MKKYKSKIDLWLVLLIGIVIGGTSVIMIINQVWLGLIINIVAAGFIVYMFNTTYYIINENDLIVKSGFIVNTTIKIDKIKKITETKNPSSSPATSLDRLLINYNNFDSIMISPKDKINFINQLTVTNPKIELKLKNKNE